MEDEVKDQGRKNEGKEFIKSLKPIDNIVLF